MPKKTKRPECTSDVGKYITMQSKYILDRDLSDREKILIALVDSLSMKHGYCSATNEYIGDILGYNKDTISKDINRLKKLNYLTIEVILTAEGVFKERRIIVTPNDGVVVLVSPGQGVSSNQSIPLLQIEDTPTPNRVGNIIVQDNNVVNKKEIDKEKVISTVKDFYKTEIDKSVLGGAALVGQYKMFANYLFAANPTGEPVEHVLRIPRQVTYDNFVDVFKLAGGNMDTIFEKLNILINTEKYAKGKKFLHLIIMNYIAKDARK